MKMLRAIFAALVAMALALTLVLAGVIAADQFYGAENWYILNKVYVEDAALGRPVRMAVDREILRDFDGRYTVTVRRLPDFDAVCSGGSSVNYTTQSKLPDPLTLKWWTYGAIPDCMSQMMPGQYEITTCIYIEPHILWLPERVLCRKSNVFRITDGVEG